ncbi:MAG: SLC13 family permease [Muribaculaceae bacterium]|nr:SLC13 family permease [Muribaculaceae bacterium]
MILSILFFPKLKIRKITVDTYWLITLVGAALVLIFGGADVQKVGEALIADTAINPLKILVLFLSMTVLSIYLDELGFFRFLANVALKRAGTGQKKLFFLLYAIVSVLTVFTSNDIIILSFTPFICYFAKNAKVNPIPYLAAEFVAANTWSMALIIGNPTNIYLATASGIGFLEYIKFSIFPTLFGGAVALGALYLLFWKKLKEPLQAEVEEAVISDKLSLWVGIAHLAVCTVFLAIGSYIGVEMWLVALCAVGSLFVFTAVISIVRKKPPKELLGCLKRTPYQLAPFVLSMFIMIVALAQSGVTKIIGEAMGGDLPILKYGISSFLAANLINNIPMSVLFSSVIQSADTAGLPAIFATVIGSNIGAFFTPIGALAGIMWGDIIGKHDVKFGYLNFLKMGVAVAVPTLFASLGGLWLATAIFI